MRFQKAKNHSKFPTSRAPRGEPSKPVVRAPQAPSAKVPSGPLFPRDWRAIVGDHAIAEALRLHLDWVECLWLKQGFESSQDLKKLHLEYKNKIPKIEIKAEAFLDRLAHSHQGAALFLNRAPELDWSTLAAKKTSKIMVLDGIEDPHNLGAILRTGWLMKVDVILIPQERSVHLTPTVHKVACGGAEHVPVQIVSNFAKTLEELKKQDYWIFGLGHEGKGTLFDLKIPEKVVWCVGAEDKGLRITTERLCDEIVRIPQVDAAASYNASVAAAMALIETHRQQEILTRK